MKITNVEVEFSSTIPIAPYSNVHVSVKWSAELGEDESAETATQTLFNKIRDEVSEAVKPIAAAKLKQTQQVIMSLPEKERDGLYQQLGIVQWLNTIAPHLKIGERETNKEDAKMIPPYAVNMRTDKATHVNTYGVNQDTHILESFDTFDLAREAAVESSLLYVEDAFHIFQLQNYSDTGVDLFCIETVKNGVINPPEKPIVLKVGFEK